MGDMKREAGSGKSCRQVWEECDGGESRAKMWREAGQEMRLGFASPRHLQG